MADRIQLSSGSFFTQRDVQRRDDNLRRMFEARRKQQATRATDVVTTARREAPDPMQTLRQINLSKEAMDEPGVRVQDPEVLDEIELRVQARRDELFFNENPKTSEWASRYDNAALAHDDLTSVGFFESLGRAFAKRSDMMADNWATGSNLDLLREMRQRAQDQQMTLDELRQQEREEALEARPEGSGRQERLRRRPQTREAMDAQEGLSEGELAFAEELTADAQALWRYIKSSPGRLFGLDAEEDIKRIEESMVDQLRVRGVEAREREMLWPTPAWRREIDAELAKAEGASATGALLNVLRVAKENPGRFTQYMVELGAENGLAIGAGIAVTTLTKSPSAGMGVNFMTSSTISEGAFFDELVEQYGYDLSTEQGVRDFLKDPRVIGEFSDKARTYGIVVGTLDALSGGVASRTLLDNPAGNLVMQSLVQATMASSGEALGRLAAGEEIDWTEVILEGLADIVTAPVEVAGMTRGSIQRKLQQASQSRRRQKTFEVLAGTVEGSKLRERDRETFAAAISEVTENGPVENVYLDPDQVEQLFQSDNMSLEEFIEAVPGLDLKAFNEARDSGQDFIIPTGVYAAHIAGTQIGAKLQKHVRLRSEDMSLADIEQFQKDLDQTQQNIASGETDALMTVIGELEGPLAEEFERLNSELQMAGRTPAVAEREASILVASARAGAQRSGMTTADYLARYTLPAIRSADDVGPAPAQPTVDPDAMLETVRNDSSLVLPEVAAIRDRLDDMGIDPEVATREDIIQAARDLNFDLPLEDAVTPGTTDKPDGEEMMQSVTLRGEEENLTDWGLKDGANKVRDIALALQERQRKLFGKTPRTQRGPKTIDKFGSWMADEIEFELQTPGATAEGWYTTKYQQALDVLAERFPEFKNGKLPGRPEITQPEDARQVFTAILAITSNGTKVIDNFKIAAEVYSNWRETGEFVMTRGQSDRIAHTLRSFERYQNLLREMPVADAADFLITPMTVSEVNAELRANGESTISGMKASMTVPRSAAVFGPKLGAFYANLAGSDGFLTMDLWWTRTINRYRGDMFPRVRGMKNEVDGKGKPIGLHRFKHLIARPDLTDDQALNYVTEYAQRYADKDYKNGTEAEKAANTIYKDAFVKLAEQPENASDREFMVAVANDARQKLFDRTGQYYSIADIQALIWYYEKRLYADLGVRDSGDVSYAEAAQVALAQGQSPTAVAESERDLERFDDQQREAAEAQRDEDETARLEAAGMDEFFQGGVPQLSEAPLPNLEKASPGRVLGVREIATQYMIDNALPVRHQADYVTVDVERATEIANLYEAMEHQPNDPEVKAAYNALIEETIAQYRALEELGFTFEWITGEDPYATPADAIRDMQENRHLWVFPTDLGFGSSEQEFEGNPLLRPTGIIINGRETVANDIFRIVHDVFGHGSEGASFGPRGEENAWQAHVRMFSPLAARAMTTETRGQNSWVNYGPFGEQNRKNPKDTVFADQKTGLLPEWVSTVGQAEDVPMVRKATDPATLADFDITSADDITLEAFERPGWGIVSGNHSALGDMSGQLRQELQERGLDFVELQGVYEGQDDGTSFLIIADDTTIQNLGQSYNQESVLTNQGLVYTDGSGRDNVPFDGIITGFDAKRQDFYSWVKEGTRDALFSLQLQFPAAPDVTVDDGDGRSHYGMAVEVDGRVHMVHWTRSPLEEIDPAQAGTGPLRGPERKRSGPKKSFFGINQGLPGGYKRESYNLGKYRHTVKIDPRSLYPWWRDPDNLQEKIPASAKTELQRAGEYERLIKEAGYLGYFVIDGPLGDVAVTFDKMRVDTVDVVNDADFQRSEAFLNWFGASQVRNSDGTPRLQFHGTRARGLTAFGALSHFGTVKAANDRIGTTFHPAHLDMDPSTRGQVIIPAYLRITNPLRVVEPRDIPWQTTYDLLWSVADKLIREGHRQAGFDLQEDISTTVGTEFAKWVEEKGLTPNTEFSMGAATTYRDLLNLAIPNSAEMLFVKEVLEPRLIQHIESAGFDGLVYQNEVEDRGRDSYVILRAEQAKSPWNSGNWDRTKPDILMQPNRGSIILPKNMSGQAQINLFTSRNLSTVLHESGHFFLWQLQKQANDGLGFAAEQLQEVRNWWLRNVDAIAAEAEVDVAQVEEYLKLGTTAESTVDQRIHRALHEQFARGFERYAMEGKSPSNAMRALFESFAAWLTAIYTRASRLQVDIDDGIRSVFDRLVATDEEIASVTDTDEVNDMIAETAREMGLDEDSYGRLVALSQEARDEAKQIARADILRTEKRMRSAEYQARLAEIEAEETERVNSKRHNRVIQWLAYGRWLGGEVPEGLPLELRLDPEILAEEHGTEIIKKLPRGRRRMTQEMTALSADEVAGWFGYDSGAEMLKEVTTLPKARDEIKAAVRARANEELGDIMGDPGEMEQAAVDALHGEKRGQVIVAEMRAMNRIGGRNQMTTRRQAKEIARKLIAKMPVRDAIQTARFRNAERRHAEQSARLLVEGKIDEAFEEKRKQLIQHEMYIEGRKAKEMMGKAERLAGRLKRKGTRENLAPEYLGAIDDILENYDFRKISGKAEVRRQRLLAYVEAMKEAKREDELAIPRDVLNTAKRIPYKTLSTQRLQGVYDALKNIEHTARKKQKLRTAQEERALEEVLDEIDQTFDENITPAKLNRVPTKRDRIMSGAKGYFNLVRNADTVLRRIDGWMNRGPMYRFFKDAIDQAGVTAIQMRQKATADLDNLFSEYSPNERRQMAVRRMWPGYDKALSKWDIISIALNTGNEGNLSRLTARDSRESFSKQELAALLDTLEKRDWDFVQSVWDYLDNEYWPQIKAREERVTGVAPQKVEAQEVKTKFGVYRGGYYPIVYDARYSAKVDEDQSQDLMNNMMAGRYGKAQTRNGHTEERTGGGGGRTVQLGMQVLFGHVNTVIHDLAYGEAVNQTWKLLQNPRVRDAFERSNLQEDRRALELWVQDVAAGPGAGTHVLAGTMRRLKSGFTISKLAFNMSTVAIQVTGMTQSMALLGSRNMARGLTQYLASGRNPYALAKEIKERSPFMAEREQTFQRDVLDLTNDIQLDPLAGRAAELQRLVMAAGFWTMQKIQYYTVDVPTWLAAHQAGLAEGMSEPEAATHADRMVARAQASGLYADRSAIERGTLGTTSRQNEFVRFFTALGSYMFAKYNVASEIVGRTGRDIRDAERSSIMAVLRGASDLALAFTLEAVAYQLVKGALPGMEGNEDDDEGWIEFLAEETALSVASVFPFIRDVSSAVQGYGGGGAYGSVGEMIGRALNAAGDAVTGEATMSDVRSMNDLVGLMVPGYPSTAAWRLIDGVGAVEEEPSPLAILLGR